MVKSLEKTKRAHLKGVHTICVALKRVKAFLSLRIPHFDLIIISARHDQFSIILHTPHRCQVSDENVQTSSIVDVPHAERCVTTAADNSADSSEKSNRVNKFEK